MIAAADLSRWLDDPERIAQSYEAAKAAKLRLRQDAFTELAMALDALVDPGADDVEALARAELERPKALQALLVETIREARSDRFFQPPFNQLKRDIHNGLILFDHPSLLILVGVMSVETLAAKKARTREASIGFPGQRHLFRFLKSGGATLSFWESPPLASAFQASGGGRCRLLERRVIEDGELVRVREASQTFVIEHAASDLLYLQAIIRVGAAPLVLEYDSNSLDFVGATSGDESASRIQMMASLLRLMEREDAAPLLIRLLDSPHFFMRWHLMRELLALDAETALPALKAMAATDPHPEVRAAATQTLVAFFEEVACPA